MIAYRAWTSLVGVLCLTGTAVAQSNYLGASDPYGVRMTRLDDSTSVRTPMLHSATPAMNPATGNSAPETVATPQPATGGVYSDALNSTGWGETTTTAVMAAAADANRACRAAAVPRTIGMPMWAG